MSKRLFRSRAEKLAGGVCGGLASYFDIDPTMVRLIAVVLFFVSGGIAIPAYLVAWVIIPREPMPAGVAPEALPGQPSTATGPSDPSAPSAPLASVSAEDKAEDKEDNRSLFVRTLPGVLLLVFGLFALFRHEFWWYWSDLFPVALILLGAFFILRQYDRSRNAQGPAETGTPSSQEKEGTLSTNGGTS